MAVSLIDRTARVDKMHVGEGSTHLRRPFFVQPDHHRRKPWSDHFMPQ